MLTCELVERGELPAIRLGRCVQVLYPAVAPDGRRPVTEATTGGWGVLVGPDSRDLRRRLRPVEWVVLEEVALEAVLDNGKAVAATSARRIADGLGIDAGIAASALRRLRSLGIVEHDRADGAASRFGLSAYILVSTRGIELVPAPEPGPIQRRATRSTNGKPTNGAPRNAPRTKDTSAEGPPQPMPRRTPRTPRPLEPSPSQRELLNVEATTPRRQPRR